MMRRNTLAVVGMAFFAFSAVVSADVTIKQALADGCFDTSEMRGIIEAGKKTEPQGSRTLEQEEKLTSDYGQKITNSKVTAPGTWVYRAYEGPGALNWHVRKLLAGEIYSKGQNDLDKYVSRGGRPEDYWKIDGPDLLKKGSSFSSSTYITMRLLALQSSDVPPSQFVTFALNYDTAKSFGQAVYALQVNPNSQILGLVNCKQSGGEVQFQILGGTTFQTLYRKVLNEEKWKRYDRKSEQWVEVPNGTVPE
jgi:hypothetical protein